MKLARTLSIVGLGASSLAALLLAQEGCGSTASTGPEEDASTSHSSSSSKSTTVTSSSGTVATSSVASSGKTSATGSVTTSSTSAGNEATDAGGPPALPDAAATTSTTVHNFAIHHLYVGDDTPTPSYTASGTAWKSIGYNIDGLDTTATCTACCTPYAKGTTAHQNGNNGIDNSFAENIINGGLSALGNLSSTVSGDIIKGSFTIQVETQGLTTSLTQTNTALGGQLFAGSTYSGTPPLTGNYFSVTDNWPVNGTLLNDPTSIDGGSKIAFPAAYVTNGTWVSGTPVNLGLTLTVEGESLQLTIHHAVISFVHTLNGTQSLATSGTISGVLETNELISAINELGGQISGGSECSLITMVAVPLIYKAQDLIIDPTTGDVSNTAGTACNAISIGLAFDADEIAPPSVIAPPTDAGTPLPACGATGDAG